MKRVSERGVVTLPPEIREAGGVQDGDIVELEFVRVVKRSIEPTIVEDIQ